MAAVPETARDADRIAAAKQALRAEVLAVRDGLPLEWRRSASRRIGDRMAAIPEWDAASTILAYASFGSEFDTHALLAAVIGASRRLVLPRVNRSPRALTLHLVSALDDRLVAGAWGIPEPDPQRCPEVAMGEVDCVLVPGVAFDARGGRLGYGGGFYDRLLAGTQRAGLVAAAYSAQLVPSVPMAAHDRRVAVVVTESATIRIR